MLNPPRRPKSGDGDVASAEGALVPERQKNCTGPGQPDGWVPVFRRRGGCGLVTTFTNDATTHLPFPFDRSKQSFNVPFSYLVTI